MLIDLQTNTGTIDGAPFRLAPRQMEILFALHSRHPYAISSDRLLALVGGFNQDLTLNTLTTHMSNIRTRLKATGLRIESAWGFGYRLVLPTREGEG